MFKKTKTTYRNSGIQFPHCDQRILHAPGECEYCDERAQWQDLRIAWGIAFTGWEPEDRELPCPADFACGALHKKWRGNVAKPLHNHLGGSRSGCPGCEWERENIDPVGEN